MKTKNYIQDLIFSLFLILIIYVGVKFVINITYLELAKHAKLPINEILFSTLTLPYFIGAVIIALKYRKEVKQVFFVFKIKYLIINIIVLLLFMNLINIFPFNYINFL